MVEKKSGITAALIALILASVGGAAFLQTNSTPTLRDVYAACEAGKLSGIACCEDMMRVEDLSDPLRMCGMVSPGNPDPLGVRKQLEDAFDKALAEGK